MSRFKRFTHSMLSGYVLLGANIIYTLASLPLALHYLSKEEFGLWIAVTSVSTNLQALIDFGMAGSISRILIDHKDKPNSAAYGSVIKTGFIALIIQGLLVTAAGGAVSFWVPQWMNIPEEFWPVFRRLMIGLCVLSGAAFAGRVSTFILQAHQRYDAGNYSMIGGFAVNLLTLWVAFEMKFGLYSFLIATAANLIFSNVVSLISAWQMKLFPAAGCWGKADWKTFRQIFSYANDIFFLSVGNVLVGLSQIPVITLMLGLEAAAIWGTMTKTFMLAQQLVARIFDFSSSAFAEMMVRGERERLRSRFPDIVVLTASIGILVGLAIALCNDSFVQIWMRGRFSWGIENDLLMAVFVIVGTSTRCHVGLAGLTKEIRAMKYVYVIEGAAFITFSAVLAPRLGLAGVILAGVVSNVLCSGVYGIWRTIRYFEISFHEVLLRWLKLPLQLLGILLVAAVALWLMTRSLPSPAQLMVNATGIGLIGLISCWRFGLPENLRSEFTIRLASIRTRFLA